jgi:cytochrome d ubiquinol oxidase subunit I
VRWKGRLYQARWLHRFAVVMGPAGLIAVTAGWIVTEAGRQPFAVYGLLRTADSVAPIEAPAIATSLAAFALVYFAMFGAGIWLLFQLFAKTPQAHEEGPPVDKPIRSAGFTVRPALAGGGRHPPAE